MEGRKVPFDYIRSSLPERHEKFLRLHKDEEYDKMSRDEIISNLIRINEYEECDSKNDTLSLVQRLKGFERKQHPMCMIHLPSVITVIC